MTGYKIYKTLVKEFSLITYDSTLKTYDSTMNSFHHYAKLENFAGFLVNVYTNTDYVTIATDVWVNSSNNENNLYFFGADNYYDIETARKQVMYLLEKSKQLKIKLKKEELEKDFKK